eukprot:gene67325-92223_t
MHDHSRVIRDAAGRPTSVVGYWLDITDRRESEERYRLIADNTADMIWIIDLTTTCFTYVSPAVYRLRGYRPEELVGRPMAEVQTPAVRDLIARDFARRATAFAAGLGLSAALAQTPVTFQLNWTAGGPNAGFAAAVGEGFYKAAGLDVTVVQGNGSGNTAQLVASGRSQLAYADAVAVSQLISKGAPMKIVST